MSKIYLIGIDHNGISAQTTRILQDCPYLFCSKRFWPLLYDYSGKIQSITPLSEAINAIKQKSSQGNVAVLASGDPLFFGIGRRLSSDFERDNLIITPAISSMQLAFAAFKLPWDNAKFISLHGRTLSASMPDIVSHSKICLLTDHKNTPNAIATALLKLNFADNSTIMVAENLGLPEEKLTTGSLDEISRQTFAPLNVMIIRRDDATTQHKSTFSLGLHEAEITHSRGLITKNEVRAAVLHHLRLPKQGVFWDIGAGSGSISVEASRLCPQLTVLAMERNPEQQDNIKSNCKNFHLPNLQLIKGEAPAVLNNLPAPNRVFIGGSGGYLAQIIKSTAHALLADGIIVLTAVIDKTRKNAPPLLYKAGFKVKISTIDVSRSTYPATDYEAKFNQITIITGTK